MTSTTNRDARERLGRKKIVDAIRPHMPLTLYAHGEGSAKPTHPDGCAMQDMADAILALLADQPLRGDEGSDQPAAWQVRFDPIGEWQFVRSPDQFTGWEARPLYLRSDQPQHSVATGHPEQGALLSGWRDISTAPKPWDWMSTHCARFLLARLYQPTDEDGEVSGPTELVWSHVAYMTASGWMLPLQGVTGLHGYGSLPLSGATHWMRLPADGEGRVPSSTTDASQASGMNNNPPPKGGE